MSQEEFKEFCEKIEREKTQGVVVIASDGYGWVFMWAYVKADGKPGF